MDRELLHAGEDLHTGVHQAFIVVLPCFLNSASLVVWVSTRVGNRTMIGEELQNVLNAARAIFGLGKARLRQLLVETVGSIKDDLANCSGSSCVNRDGLPIYVRQSPPVMSIR